MVLNVVLLAASLVIILAAAELFTNGVEWLGRKLNLGEGAVGSLLAAVGTALPETLVPLVAILFSTGTAAHEIGIGAILGAPFMLSTAAMFVTGLAILLFTRQGRRTTQIRINPVILERDVRFFLIVYAAAIAASFVSSHTIKVGIAVVLVLLYGYYVVRTLSEEGELGEDLHPLHFNRFFGSDRAPPLGLVVLQVLVALGLIVLGARVFVVNTEVVAMALGASPLVLSLIIAPLATELPEKFNSVTWVRNWKDTLALGNITGAMVFQSCIPVAVGLVLTEWVLNPHALASAAIALASSTLIWSMLRFQKRLTPQMLTLGGLMYALFIVAVIVLPPASVPAH